MKEEDWERAGGFYCPKCGNETVRLKEITPGIFGCPECYIKYAENFSQIEASLKTLTNSDDSKLARMIRRQVVKNMPL